MEYTIHDHAADMVYHYSGTFDYLLYHFRFIILCLGSHYPTFIIPKNIDELIDALNIYCQKIQGHKNEYYELVK